MKTGLFVTYSNSKARMIEIEASKENFRDTILLENTFRCTAYTFITPLHKENYTVKIEFVKLSFEEFKKILELSRLKKSLKISSHIISKSNYRITHIVVTDYTAKSDFSMTWKCLSDNSKDKFYNSSR